MTRLARSRRLVPSSQALTSSGVAGADLCVVEGLPLVEEEARCRRPRGSGTLEIDPSAPGTSTSAVCAGQVGDLTEPAPALVLEHDVRPSPERQSVERRLELERAAVDRRGQREQGPLDAVTDVAVVSDLLGQRVARLEGSVHLGHVDPPLSICGLGRAVGRAPAVAVESPARRPRAYPPQRVSRRDVAPSSTSGAAGGRDAEGSTEVELHRPAAGCLTRQGLDEPRAGHVHPPARQHLAGRARAGSSSARVRRTGRRSAGTPRPPPPAPCDRVRAAAPSHRPARARRRSAPPASSGRAAMSSYRSVSPASQATPDGPRTRWPLAALGRCGIGLRVVDRPHEPHLDPAVRPQREPLVVGEPPAVESLAPHPDRVVRSGEDRHPGEELEGGDLGVVVVQVGEEYGVRVRPGRSGRLHTAPAQDAVVASQQRVGDDPHAVEIHDGRGVTEPRDVNAHVSCSPHPSPVGLLHPG